VAVTADEDEDEDDIDEKELGIALFLTILVGCNTAIYLPGLSIACGIAATVIASVLHAAVAVREITIREAPC
jgi:hypothetical protein